ncbi:MAG TPA: hypothetical protein VGP19_14920 [Candidatus Acidoferrales bacterium]|jgi:hypothetical protein|nr:hypothetical protein [Candidatus Acidoferrales bacterium]
METFLNGAMVIEGALLSFLLALCMTWLGLHGLFQLMPGTAKIVQPIRFVVNPHEANRRSDAA